MTHRKGTKSSWLGSYPALRSWPLEPKSRKAIYCYWWRQDNPTYNRDYPRDTKLNTQLMRERRKLDPEHHRELARKAYWRNPEKARERSRKRRAEKRDEVNRRQREIRALYREQRNKRARFLRARKREQRVAERARAG